MIYQTKREDFARFTSEENFKKIVELDNIGDFLNHLQSNFLDLDAIIKENGEAAKYSELLTDIKRAMALLNAKNVKKGCNIGILFNNSYSFVVNALAVMAYGAVAVLLPIQLDEKIVFGCSKKYVLAGLIYEQALVEKVKLINPNECLLVSSEEVFAAQPLEIEKFEILDKKLPAAIIMTGGTSGRSKGALLSHEALLAGTVNGCYGIKEFMHLRYYCLLPLTHVFGFIRNVMTCLFTGSVIMFNQNKKLMFNEMQAFKPTILVIVPALAELFLNLSRAYGKAMLGGELHTIICGAAFVPPYLTKEWNKLGVVLFPGYGLTESANLVSGNPMPLEYPDSVGMLFPHQEAKVVNDELYLKGNNIMIQYFNEPEENPLAFDEEGWFKTGDLVRFDEHQNLYIIGRSKDVIVLNNGENVSPAYIEGKIDELPFIQDCLVTEAVSEFGAQILQVEVLLRPAVANALGLSPEALKEYVEQEIEKVNQTLLDYERVSKIIIRDKDFDRTPAMKIIRPKKVF